VSFGSVIGPALFAPPLTFLIIVVGWRSAFALLGGIGLLWVVIWLLVEREHPDKSNLAGDETYVGHPWTRWSQILPIIFSRTVIFSTLAGFGVAFLAFARPDDQQLEEKRSIGVVGLHE
jgi:MFS family permease